MEVLPTQGAAIGAEPTHVLLRKARREAGLSQNEVARRLGMDVLEYRRIECGSVDISEEQSDRTYILKRIANTTFVCFFIGSLSLCAQENSRDSYPQKTIHFKLKHS